MVFDGRAFAEKIEIEIRDRVVKMARKPKLVAVVDPENEAGMKYCQIKAKMAERLGVEFEILNLKFLINDLKLKIKNWNLDNAVNGIIIQMPFPGSERLIPIIGRKKDVDGLRDDSPYLPAVVRAVVEILGHSFKESPFEAERIILVGSKGFVGRKLYSELRTMNYELTGMDKNDFDPEKLKTADVIISTTGQKNLIGSDMVRDGFIAIDVGYPDAEFTLDALAKASFYTPVPGGVGPVTVVMLFANLLKSVNETKS